MSCGLWWSTSRMEDMMRGRRRCLWISWETRNTKERGLLCRPSPNLHLPVSGGGARLGGGQRLPPAVGVNLPVLGGGVTVAGAWSRKTLTPR